MCCFSRPVEHVSKTSIFARSLADGRQALVYSMQLAAFEELAMVLPLPVPVGAPDDAVEFVSLQGYDDFFDDLSAAFPKQVAPIMRGGPLAGAAGLRPQTLKVHSVGDFEASFVPTAADFSRLDERFRLAPNVIAALPGVADWGFAVFKLKQPERGFLGRMFGGGLLSAKPRRFHPMAMLFPRRDPGALFFPTVHVHDGEVHERAEFDHTLYCQPDPVVAATFGWESSDRDLGDALRAERCGELIDPSALGFRRTLSGHLPNRDRVLQTPPCVHPERLVYRGTHFELRIGATSAYAEPEHAAPLRVQTARRHLDALSEVLAEEMSAAVAESAPAPIAYDPALMSVFPNDGELIAFITPDGPLPPKPDQPLRLQLRVESERVEPQHISIALASPPEPAQLAALQSALDGALARAERRVFSRSGGDA